MFVDILDHSWLMSIQKNFFFSVQCSNKNWGRGGLGSGFWVTGALGSGGEVGIWSQGDCMGSGG